MYVRCVCIYRHRRYIHFMESTATWCMYVYTYIVVDFFASIHKFRSKFLRDISIGFLRVLHSYIYIYIALVRQQFYDRGWKVNGMISGFDQLIYDDATPMIPTLTSGSEIMRAIAMTVRLLCDGHLLLPLLRNFATAIIALTVNLNCLEHRSCLEYKSRGLQASTCC